jgi:hypothetical protein
MHVNTVSTGDERCFSRWDRMSRASFLPSTVNMTNSRNPVDSLEPPQSAQLDFTVHIAVPSSWTELMYRRGIDTTIKDTKGISILYSTSNSVLESTLRSSTRAIKRRHSNQTQDRRLCSRSVRDSSTFDRLDSWGKLLVESLERRRTIPMSIRPVTTGLFRHVSSSVRTSRGKLLVESPYLAAQ